MPTLRNQRQAHLLKTFLLRAFKVAKLFYSGLLNAEEFTEDEETILTDALYLMDLLLIQENDNAPPSPTN